MKKTFEYDQTKYDQNAPTRTEQFLTANGVKTLTTDANDGAVLIQDSVDPDSLNPVTAAAVATAVAGASGEVPVIGNSDNGKVLKAVVDGEDKHVEWGEVQSGTSYTAGTGINITNDTISVSNPLPSPTTAGKILSVNNRLQAAWVDAPASSAPLIITYDPDATASQINSIGDSIRAALQANRPMYLRILPSDPRYDYEKMIPFSDYAQVNYKNAFTAMFAMCTTWEDGSKLNVINYIIKWGSAESSPGWTMVGGTVALQQ